MILIVGATGRISKAVIAQLRAASLPIRILAPDLPNPAAFGLDVEVVTERPSLPETWSEVCAGIQALYCSTPGAPTQLALQLEAIREAQRAGVKRIIKISNFGSAAQSDLVQARWNWQLEAAIRASGLQFTFLRPRFLMQNFLMVFAPLIKSQSAFCAPAGDGRIPYVDLRDVAEAAVAVLTEPGHESRTYELTGPEALSCEALASRFSAALNRTVRFEDVGPEEGPRVFSRLGLPGPMANDIAAMYLAARSKGTEDPTTAIPEITGKPARSLDLFLSENLAAFSG